jgi:hypothetical protein
LRLCGFAALRETNPSCGEKPPPPAIVTARHRKPRRKAMSGPRRDSSDGTRGGPVHGRGGKSVDDNKKSGGGHGKSGGGQDDNARKPGG